MPRRLQRCQGPCPPLQHPGRGCGSSQGEQVAGTSRHLALRCRSCTVSEREVWGPPSAQDPPTAQRAQLGGARQGRWPSFPRHTCRAEAPRQAGDIPAQHPACKAGMSLRKAGHCPLPWFQRG